MAVSPELIVGITSMVGLLGGMLPRVILSLVKSHGDREVKIEEGEAAYRAATFAAAKDVAAAGDKLRGELRDELKTTRDMLAAAQVSERTAWDRVRQLEIAVVGMPGIAGVHETHEVPRDVPEPATQPIKEMQR